MRQDISTIAKQELDSALSHGSTAKEAPASATIKPSDMTTEPLWKRLAAMTEVQVEAMRTADLARFKSGELSKAEAEEKQEASSPAAEYHAQQAWITERAQRLAQATGCPENAPVLPWLVKHGLAIEHDDGGFEITERGTIFAKAQSIIDEALINK